VKRAQNAAAAPTEVYISVDIEASGPVAPDYSMLSLGACVAFQPQSTFYVELRPIGGGAVPAALEVAGHSLEEFERRGRDPADAMRLFRDWIASVSLSGDPVFVGFNAAFDWAFVNWYFHHFLGDNPFGVGSLDIKSYYMGKTGGSWADTRSSRIPDELKDGSPETHNALDDAIRQAHLFQKLSRRVNGL
jgi:ribonuclease T